MSSKASGKLIRLHREVQGSTPRGGVNS